MGDVAVAGSFISSRTFSAATDGAAADVDGDVAIRFTTSIVMQLTIFFIFRIGEEEPHRSQTTAAIDGAEHGAASDNHIGIAAHGSRRECLTAEATAAAEDVAVHVRGTPGTNLGTITDVHLCIA